MHVQHDKLVANYQLMRTEPRDIDKFKSKVILLDVRHPCSFASRRLVRYT